MKKHHEKHCHNQHSINDVRVHETFVRLNHQTPGAFPEAILAEARTLLRLPTAEDMAQREDLRTIPFVTIDGEDARDFDDAIHVQPLDTGWLLRVAIADVSHYIPLEMRSHKTCLDTEAQQRANSWYFPLSVSPMLPESLSNELCSLNPGVDRLVMLCEMPFTHEGAAGKPRFSQAVMRSAARLTYTQIRRCLIDKNLAAQRSLTAQTGDEYILAMLGDALTLSRILRVRRMARGSLDFHQPEPSYTITKNARVSDIFLSEHHEGHELIEEFMLATNEAVATFLHNSKLPFLYRVHPEPGKENLERLKEALLLSAPDCLPESIRVSDAPLLASHIREILRLVHGTARERVVNSLCLRSLARARYQSTPLDHFGLASACYCHFTSPIRRYADLTVHRALKMALGLNDGPLLTGHKLERLAAHCNYQERAAQEAEREMTRRMACLAMRHRIGATFNGVVSSVMPFGTFVTLEGLPVEAFMRRHRFPRGRHDNGRPRWHLGQEVKVRLTSICLIRLTIDCEPAGDHNIRISRSAGSCHIYRRRRH